ncbi:methyl-accepting chemotaxis protein WspA [Pseudomonas guineae]|uniref:Methyl-accepting chemotaxis protein WspA n=1 Tax=Pseudomonas guineae TaxID=425504 RepID=A0A1I3DIK3_9PSED|nr:methyl-accepting chemotaxis protein [Pseudomonas guineae]SFH86409.1 methyl-accepting chemotaxis protein WspA [Pseudomonas guineae]
MKNWTVRQRIIASFSVVVVILLLLSATAYYRLATVEQSAINVRTSAAPGMELAGLMRLAWADHLLESQRLLMAGQDNEARRRVGAEASKAFAELAQRLDRNWTAYQATISTEPERLDAQNFLVKRDQYLALHAQLLELTAAGRDAEASQLVREQLTPAWLEARAVLTQLFELNQQYAEQAVQQIVTDVGVTKLSLVLAILIVLGVAALSSVSLQRAISQPIIAVVETFKLLGSGDLSARLDMGRRDEFNAIEEGFNSMAGELKALVAQAQRSAVQMTTSITEIAATSRQQQATATETAATTTEIGATSREIAATSRDLVRTMSEVSGTAEHTSVLAGSGQLGLARMEDVMRHVVGAADVVNAKLAILNEKAGNINHVVTTIVKVADQTNLLSLNAAIEAEKAGEYGRGFAVVATQVRRLADQTAVATYDIEQMVREIQSAVSAGVMGMDKFSEEVRRGNSEMSQVGDQLSQIIHQVQALAPRVQMMDEGMQAQATGAEQINQALVQLSEASGQTVDSLRQAGAAIDELNQVAGSLRSGVSRFKV